MNHLLGSTLQPVRGGHPLVQKTSVSNPLTLPSKGKSVFEDQLQKSIEPPLAFSAHAASRLKLRNIALTPIDLEALNKAVSQVADKGGKESLIYYKNTGFVVSIPNRTVITAIDGLSKQEHIFTQIDSAMIVS